MVREMRWHEVVLDNVFAWSSNGVLMKKDVYIHATCELLEYWAEEKPP